MNEKRISPIGTQPTPRWAYFVVWLLSALPWVPVFALYAFAIRAWVKLGHWPQPEIDRPDSLDLDVWHEIAGRAMQLVQPGMWVSITLVVIALLARHPRVRHWTKSRWFLLAALHAMLAFIFQRLLFAWDPFETMAWYQHDLIRMLELINGYVY